MGERGVNGIIENFKSTHFKFETYNTIKNRKKNIFLKHDPRVDNNFALILGSTYSSLAAISGVRPFPTRSRVLQIYTLWFRRNLRRKDGNSKRRLTIIPVCWTTSCRDAVPRLVSYVIHIKVYIFSNTLPKFTLLKRFTYVLIIKTNEK